MSSSRFILFFSAVGLLTFLWSDTAQQLYILVTTVDTYSHGQIVPFISLALIWSRKDQLKGINAFYSVLGLAALFGASALWLLGSIMDIKVVSHFSYVFAIQSLVLAIWGRFVFAALLFPLCFLLLSVPIGHSLVAVMQHATADMVIKMLALLGVDYTANGVLITLKSGIYEVARACAGIRFLFTSIVTGVLLAHLAYRSWWKRIVLVVFAAVIPIFANALRVLGILLISEATDQSFAKGVDHIVYGWGFLSFVLIILIAGAYKFSDVRDDVAEKPVKASSFPLFFQSSKPSVVKSVLILLGVFTIPFIAFHYSGAVNQPLLPVGQLDTPQCKDCDVRLLEETDLTDEVKTANQAYKARYRMGADFLNVEAALFCPVQAQTGMPLLPAFEGWERTTKIHGNTFVVDGWEFEEKHYIMGDRKKISWTTTYIHGSTTTSMWNIKFIRAKERLQFGKSAEVVLRFSVDVMEGAPEPKILFEKFLSTFPANQFLWPEIVPDSKGKNICVA